MAVRKRIPPNLETLEVLPDEVDEYYGLYKKVRQKLRCLRRGSAPYLDLLPDLDVELFTLKLKVEDAYKELDDFEESLSDDDKELIPSNSGQGKPRP